MPQRIRIQPDDKLPLELTAAEQLLVLEGLTMLDPEYEAVVWGTPAGEPIMLTLDDLDDLGG